MFMKAVFPGKYIQGEGVLDQLTDWVNLLGKNGLILASRTAKEKVLIKTNCKTELLKILFRISLNCLMIYARQYLEVENKLQEIGKMTQGWIKYTRNQK